MKRFFVTLGLVCLCVFGSGSAARSMETCYKVEFTEETFSYVAPEAGTYTFKGGNVEHSPNGYLITVTLAAGEVWEVPLVNGRIGAAISHVVVCPSGEDPVDPEDPDCIYKDPAVIRYAAVDKFKMHGRILPKAPLDISAGFEATLVADGVTLVEFGVADVEARGTKFVGRSDSSKFVVGARPGGIYSLKIRHTGEIEPSPSNQIVFTFIVADQLFQVSGTWAERKNGWFLSNRAFLCPLLP